MAERLQQGEGTNKFWKYAFWGTVAVIGVAVAINFLDSAINRL